MTRASEFGPRLHAGDDSRLARTMELTPSVVSGEQRASQSGRFARVPRLHRVPSVSSPANQLERQWFRWEPRSHRFVGEDRVDAGSRHDLLGAFAMPAFLVTAGNARA